MEGKWLHITITLLISAITKYEKCSFRKSCLQPPSVGQESERFLETVEVLPVRRGGLTSSVQSDPEGLVREPTLPGLEHACFFVAVDCRA